MKRLKLMFIRHLLNKTPEKSMLFVLKILGIKVGTGAYICQPDYIDTDNITIGSHAFINHDLYIYTRNYPGTGITIGDHVFLGPKVKLLCVGHNIGTAEQRAGIHKEAPIIIEDGSWIGLNATIMPGVTIAKGCVIGANATVTKSTTPNGIYVGTPAKRIRDLD